MADALVDTSVALKWVLKNEPDAVLARQRAASTRLRGDKLFLLDLAMIEAANGISVQMRRKLLTEDEARDAWLRLKRAPVSIIRMEPLLDDAFALALKYKIASYDAAFVAAAQHLGCEGVTADVPLVKAVGKDFPSIKLLKDW